MRRPWRLSVATLTARLASRQSPSLRGKLSMPEIAACCPMCRRSTFGVIQQNNFVSTEAPMKRAYGITMMALILASACALGQQQGASTAQKNAPYDQSNWLSLLAAAEAGGGWDSGSPRQATALSGVKLGWPGGFYSRPGGRDVTFTLDLGYDRVRTANGFSAELSPMLPVFRFPKPQRDENKNYLRVYAEPGLGYRSAGFGGYGSAKVMIAFFSDSRLNFRTPSPYVEFQRRFPFNSPLQGDNRLVFGIMVALCNHCGLD